MENNEFISRDTYQINLPDGSIDFLSVDDLPKNLSEKFAKKNVSK
jgi:hypothetical protein